VLLDILLETLKFYRANTIKMAIKRFLFSLLFCCFATTNMAQTGEQEANLKAAFIYNFTKYIDWGNYNNENFVIGVMGKAPIVESLKQIAKTNLVNNQRIEIKVYNRPSEIGKCDILFIPKENRFSLKSILDRTGKGVLTISEQREFAKEGTAFNFVIINDKLKFEANLKAISSAGLKAGSQLLKLAIIVD
jgi:hypothetical protein